MLPYIVRRVDRGHVLLSDGWAMRAPAPTSPPLRLPRHSLQDNDLEYGYGPLPWPLELWVRRSPAGRALL